MLLTALAFAVLALAVLAYVFIFSGHGGSGDVHDVAGDHPGDLSPGVRRADDVRRYGFHAGLAYDFRVNSLGMRGEEPTFTPRT